MNTTDYALGVSEVEHLRAAIEHAPPPTATADGLLGWRSPAGTFVCASCASRILGRGCALPRQSVPVWTDSPVAGGECCTCSPVA